MDTAAAAAAMAPSTATAIATDAGACCILIAPEDAVLLDGEEPEDVALPPLPVWDAADDVAVAVDPAPVTVKTPPDGAAARHCSAALDASVAVLGAAVAEKACRNQRERTGQPSRAGTYDS